MPGTFFGITIGQSGLAAAQLGEDITGQNIANAGTPGYSVQTLDQTASDPYTNADRATLLTPGLIGTGVSIRSIQRAGDQFLDTQVRDANSGLQGQTAQSDALKQVGSVFGEPSATGLNAALTSFFNAFHDLANSPESAGVRAATVQQGVSLAHTFGTVSAGLASVASGVAGRTASAVEEINSDSAQIAALNVSIRASTRGGQTPNDLVDRRGVLLDNLAGLTNISVQNTADGGVNVSVGSTALVAGSDSFAASLPSLLAAGVSGGTLGGLHAASLQVAALQTQLHAAAASVASQVNAAQANGLDLSGNPGTPFFHCHGGQRGGHAGSFGRFTGPSRPPRGGFRAGPAGDIRRGRRLQRPGGCRAAEQDRHSRRRPAGRAKHPKLLPGDGFHGGQPGRRRAGGPKNSPGDPNPVFQSAVVRDRRFHRHRAGKPLEVPAGIPGVGAGHHDRRRFNRNTDQQFVLRALMPPS